MIMKSNLGKMLGRMAPMARNNMPQGGLGMAAPRAATGHPMPQNPMMAVPHPIVDTPENIQRMPQSRGLADAGSMLAKFAEQFRNTDNMTNTRPGMFGGMQPRTLTPEEAMAIASMPATRPAPMPEVVVQPRPTMPEAAMPEPTMPAFDPNRALNDYNNRLAGIYAGGGNMDMNMVRAQQANLRNLQLDRNATAEQHDAAYRAALSELRSRYPDAFAG